MDDAKLQITHAPLGDSELPEQLDPDFYREALLHIARLTADRLLRERSALADLERRAKIPLGATHSPDAITVSTVVERRVRLDRDCFDAGSLSSFSA
jgi:hypothetical protein